MRIEVEVANWLQRMGFGTLYNGTTGDIFTNQMPQSTNGYYIIRSGGPGPNNYVPIENNFVDIYCKNTKSSTAITNLESIKKAIHRMHNTTINDAYVYSFLVIGDTFSFLGFSSIILCSAFLRGIYIFNAQYLICSMS